MFITLSIADSVANIFHSLCDGITSLVNKIYSLLPASPFPTIEKTDGVAQVIGYLNWYLPIGDILVIASAWLGAVLIIFVGKIILNFFKVVQG